MKKSQLQIQIYLQIILFGFNLTYGFSQEIHLALEALTRKDGLNNRFIDFIKKDTKGNIWLSSLNGVFRYDGLEMKHYAVSSNNANDSSHLWSNDIQSNFFEISSGDIFFTPKNGINRYCRKSDTFQAIRLKRSDIEIRSDYSLFYIEQDSVLWLKADGNIYTYNINSKRTNHISPTKGYRFTVKSDQEGNVQTIYSCPWIISPGVEVLQIEKGELIKDTLLLADGIPPGFKSPLSISKVIVDNDTLVWLFSPEGLIALNPLQPRNNVPYTLPGNQGSHIKDGAKVENYLFIGSKNRGLWLFDTKKRTFIQNWTKENSNQLADNDIREVYYDESEEQIWLSYQNKLEVNHSRLYKNNFHNPFSTLNTDLPVITSILEDNRNQIWVSSLQSGIYVFDQKGVMKKKYVYDKNFNAIQKLSISKEHQIWAINDKAIFQLKNNNSWLEFTDKAHEKLFTLIHIAKDHKLISTSKGLIQFKTIAGKVSETLLEGDYQVMYALHSKFDNYLYFSNRGSELAIFKYFREELSEDTIIDVNADIYHIFEDSSTNSLLLGTSKGTQQLDLATFKVSRLFDIPDYSPLNKTGIYFVSRDKKGRYWATTDYGIFSISSDKKKILRYRKEDGFTSQNFTLHANLLASDGKIWLGTNEGLVLFHPDSIRPYPHGPIIQVNQIKTHGVALGQRKFAAGAKAITIKHSDYPLEFQVTAVNHYLPKYNIIRYQMTGLDGEYNEVHNGEEIRFLKLPAGDYSLVMQGINANGIPGLEKNFAVTITPPFTRTKLFYSLCVVAFLMLIYIYNHLTVRARLRQQEKAFRFNKPWKINVTNLPRTCTMIWEADLPPFNC